MFVFLLVLAIIAVSALVVFMFIELNTVELVSRNILSDMRKRYGDE